MGKRAVQSGQSSVENYRKKLGQHEKHVATSRHRPRAMRTKDIAQAKYSKPLKNIALYVVLLLVVIAVVYFVSVFKVSQWLTDAVEWWKTLRSTS